MSQPTRKIKATARRYPDRVRAQAIAVLEANGGNLHAASRDLAPLNDGREFSRATLRNWWRAYQEDPESFLPDQLVQDSRENFLRMAEQVIEKGTQVVLDKLDDVSAKEAAVIVGIYTDKARLVAGQPTQITESKAVAQLEPGVVREIFAELISDMAKAKRRAEAIEGEVLEAKELTAPKEKTTDGT